MPLWDCRGCGTGAHEPWNSALVRLLLREILACQCLAPLVNRMSEPDYVNRWIVYACGRWGSHFADEVVVRVLSAHGLNLLGMRGPGELYCTVHLGHASVTTQRVTRSATVHWNEELLLPISSASSTIVVVVHHANPLGRGTRRRSAVRASCTDSLPSRIPSSRGARWWGNGRRHGPRAMCVCVAR